MRWLTHALARLANERDSLAVQVRRGVVPESEARARTRPIHKLTLS